ncbi:DUF1002 domain-containing protein [Staphylococcus aureus]|uniref:DUF1002 domain-containing protein n=1 Tax=Staphylococcus aureus TaxID=1280 RepID=UPI00211146AE|nr:DUF1002 domain-containing protein [Staphylococcus aureus]MCQ6827904.1 DUF1002 domain-containing protein [Staphylococcus aureus]
MYKKTKVIVATMSVLLLNTGGVAFADSNKLNEDIFIKGADLNSQQLEETKKKLDVNDDYKEISITTNDVAKYTGNNNLSFIHSSATITPKKFKKGVTVDIETPENITRITKEQYTNAAITAGIQDSEIKVASIDKVTGEGALTGIYKAYEENGNSLNKNDVQNANKEMNDLASISEQNKGQKGYSDEALNNAIAEMKKEIASEKQDGKDLTREDVSKIVNDVLKENGLNKILSDNQINVVNNIMVNVSNSEILNKDPKAYEKQAKDLASNIKDKAGNLLDKAKELNTEENRNILQRMWDAIVEFFKKIINWLLSWF